MLPGKSGRRRWPLWAALGLLPLGAAAVGAFVYLKPSNTTRPDVVTQAVKYTELNVTVTEKGTLESADNRDVVCKVRAGNKGYSTTINWVVDDGSMVKQGQLLVLLDDSDLQDKYRAQKIILDQATAAKLSAEEQYLIVLKQNEINIATAETNVAIAELDLEKYTGHKADPAMVGVAAAAGVAAMIAESGEYKQFFDEVTGRLRLAESDVEQNRERAAWADRMVKMRYMSAAQAQSERSRLDSSLETLRKTQTERNILENFTRVRTLTQLRSDLDNKVKAVDQARKQASATESQADIDRRTKRSIFVQEQDKLKDIEDQIRECKIHAPQEGMVVYNKPESSRFSSTSQGLIEQGAQVKEGQKLLRLPNLKRMQVNTKVHEAMVSRINGDVRVSTGLLDAMRVGLLANPHAMTRLVSQNTDALEAVHEKFRNREFRTSRRGDRAVIRVDAFPDRAVRGHVRSVAAVASQADFFGGDVKLYQTLVMIDGLAADPDPLDDPSLDRDEARSAAEQSRDAAVVGMKPDMTAEVTIHVDKATEPVLAVPLQAVVGGTEMGATRKVFVATGTGYEERAVTLGLYNEKLVEVRDGLHDGDEVVLNPKVLVGDKAKTRDAAADNGKAGPGDNGGSGAKKGFNKKKGPPAGSNGGQSPAPKE